MTASQNDPKENSYEYEYEYEDPADPSKPKSGHASGKSSSRKVSGKSSSRNASASASLNKSDTSVKASVGVSISSSTIDTSAPKVSKPSVKSEIKISSSPTEASAPIQETKGRHYDEVIKIGLYTDGYVEDDQLKPFKIEENKIFIEKLKKRDSSIIPNDKTFRYDIVHYDFPYDELNERNYQEFCYQIDIYPDYFTVNKGAKRYPDEPTNQSFLDALVDKKVPKELLRPGYVTSLRVCTFQENAPPEKKLYEKGIHHKKVYQRPKGNRAQVDKVEESPFNPKVRRTKNPYLMRNLTDLDPLYYKLPEGIKYNPYDPKVWFVDSNFQFSGDVDEYLAQLEPEEISKLRNQISIENAINVLEVLGHDLSKMNFEDFNQFTPHVLFVIVNSYKEKNLSLGSGPISDGILVSSFYRHQKYKVYFLHNPKPDVFVKWLQKLIQITYKRLVIYYSGRRTEIFDYDDKKVTALNHVMLFDEGYLLDKDLRLILQKNPKGDKCRILLISDLYESGSVWYFTKNQVNKQCEYFSNIVSITSVYRSPDLVVPENVIHQHGLFTYCLFAYARYAWSLCPNSARNALESFLKYYHYLVKIQATKKELFDENLLSSF